MHSIPILEHTAATKEYLLIPAKPWLVMSYHRGNMKMHMEGTDKFVTYVFSFLIGNIMSTWISKQKNERRCRVHGGKVSSVEEI